jgi:16S rRNA (cytosine967-C5)-methyltransferase
MDKINNKKRKGIRQKTYFAVLELLNSTAAGQKYPDMLIGGLFKKEDFTPDEKAIIVDTVYGLLRHRGRIDHIIEHASSAQISSLQLNLFNILRICIYQLSFTSTSPAGVVNNAVALTSSYEKGRFTGFVKRACEALI